MSIKLLMYKVVVLSLLLIAHSVIAGQEKAETWLVDFTETLYSTEHALWDEASVNTYVLMLTKIGRPAEVALRNEFTNPNEMISRRAIGLIAAFSTVDGYKLEFGTRSALMDIATASEISPSLRRLASTVLREMGDPLLPGLITIPTFLKAAAIGDLEQVKLLSDLYGYDLYYPSMSRLRVRTTALIEAAANGHVDIVQFLISVMARIPSYLNERNVSGETALYAAAKNGHHDIVVQLLRAGAQDYLHRTADFYTKLDGHQEIKQFLLRSDENPGQ